MKERLFKLRMAQLDLARQMETVEYVQNFIDFISRYDYNAFFLYIEWRIRTDTFDIGEKKGLSKDEIRQIVAYAAERGVDVIPALNCFGHSGELLSRQEYHELAELKDGQTGLEHSGDKHVFCLSNPKSKAFIASYIKEVAELFPAQYIHIGFDEALDVGFCPECAEKCAGAAGEQRLILEHLEFCRNTAVQCGKRSIIWDDMLPNYPLLLKELSRDIIIASWQYHQNVPEFTSYCFNATFRNTLQEFREAGFDTIVATADLSWVNNDTFSSYGRREGAMGGLITVWERARSFQERGKLTIAAAGLYWSGRAVTFDEAFEMAAKDIFGDISPEMLSALFLLLASGFKPDQISSPASIMRHQFMGPNESLLRQAVTIQTVLRPKLNDYVKGSLAWNILQDMLIDARTRELSLRSQKAAYRMLHRIDGEKLSCIAKEVPGLFAEAIEMCGALRHECAKENFIKSRDSWVNTLLSTEKRLAEHHTLCRVMFCLPLTYGNMLTRITAYYGDKAIPVTAGNFKISNGYEMYTAHFEWFFIFPADFKADRVKIETGGFTGIGVSFINFTCGDKRYVPENIIATAGKVADPSYILAETDTFCYFGSQDGFETARDRKAFNATHSVELSLKEIRN